MLNLNLFVYLFKSDLFESALICRAILFEFSDSYLFSCFAWWL